jgi:redox-sensitive bicupin YhaK (pirin superfamily)
MAGFESRHSFSFAGFHDPEREGFGLLRALNEERLDAGAEVPLHSHQGMEILTIPLAGLLRLRDSRGIAHTIRPGEVHLLSAGVGIAHWEYNDSRIEPARYLQLWLRPDRAGTPVRYAQGCMPYAAGRFVLAAAPAVAGGVVTLGCDVHVSLATGATVGKLAYARSSSANSVYVFLADGALRIGADVLGAGDGLALTGAPPEFEVLETCTVTCIEVPPADGQ